MRLRARAALYLSMFAIAGCQVVTGLRDLRVVDAGEQSQSPGTDPGTDAAPPEDASRPPESTPNQTDPEKPSKPARPIEPVVDAGCARPSGDACDLLTQCGCKADAHCQARGPTFAPACFASGPLEPGAACKANSECPRGQTCDDHTCRAYCRDEADCAGGRCAHLQSTDSRASDLRVCWARCSVDDPSVCGPGVRCRALQSEDGGRDTYCAAPADPCPSTEDGTCDDARGTGVCADATDARDCDCSPQLPDAKCDPFAQCGCPRADACAITRAEDGKVSAACTAWLGTKRDDASCQNDSECAPGYVCQFGGTCLRLCESDAQCGGRACLPIALSDRPNAGLKVCYARCDRANPGCAAGTRCARFDDRFEIQGDYCIAAVAKCRTTDGVCDEASGTGLCADETDIVDCCQPSLPDGECDLVLQCGCEKKPGTNCSEVQGEQGRTSACVVTGTIAPNQWCVEDPNCGRGSGCVGHVCRPYCEADDDCAGGGRCVFAVRNGVTTSIKVCFGPCNTETHAPCGAHTVCNQGMIEDGFSAGCTFQPLAGEACPRNNGRCDEPQGSGICGEASDPEDCS